jgi:carbamoyltransferase
MRLLGISAYYHDSAACLIDDGNIVAAAQEERFTRIKQDHSFPARAVKYCLAEGGLDRPLDGVVFYDKPLLKFHRIMETYLNVAPKGLTSYLKATPLWLRKKLWIPAEIEDALKGIGVDAPAKFYFPEHHESHAASAFYPSPFQEAAILTVDGVGEWATSTISVGEGNKLNILRELRFPHSIGLLYSAFTYFTGFRVNSGEYKLMGLAPYGRPEYTDLILDKVIELKDDGSFRMNMEYFGYADGLTMTNDKFADLFGGPARTAESPITRREMDIARSIQDVTEKIVMGMARHAREITGKRFLCLAGGVALNCVANGKLLREGIFDDIWIQPAAGDAGGALGAALTVWFNALDNPRQADGVNDFMQGAYLGPEFPDELVEEYLTKHGYGFEKLTDDNWGERLAGLIDEGNVLGLHHGRMEFGPRALGNRSIVGDPRSPKMQSVMNLKIKYRESFRPFAPACLAERAPDYFEIDRASPYMLLVAPVKEDRRIPLQGDEDDLPLVEWVNRPRSDIPAITHVDHSARVQTVSDKTNPRFSALIKAFYQRTGFAIVINTSFNVRGEPIVCTPEDAYRCFMRTEMDYLVLGSYLLAKTAQPDWDENADWRSEFALD